MGGIDKDRYAIETAKNNIPEGKWEQLSIEELVTEVKTKKTHPIFAANVIITGLPCQGFSIAGKQDPADYRNKLYKYLLKIVEEVRPKYVVVENVYGLLFKINKYVFNDLLNSFGHLGYNVDYRVYNSIDFEIPQTRKRIFVVAAKEIPVRYIFEGVHFSDKSRTVRDAFEGLSQTEECEQLNHTFMKHSERVLEKIRKIHNTKLISYRRLLWDQPSVTIISGHNALPLHPKRHRAISNREAARLQGIPDAFIFKGPRTAQTIQVANAVPFSMTCSIARAVKNSHEFLKLCNGDLFKQLTQKTDKIDKKYFRKEFIGFYKKCGRKYPWRNISDPYKILLTEILLQRTKGDMVQKVWKRVIDSVRYTKGGFRQNLKQLGKSISKIGLFNKVDTIKRLNTFLFRRFRNKVPENFDELMNLPGVGIYISSAVRTFAFNIPDFPVDANSFRFVGRFYGIKVCGKKSEARQIREFMNEIIDPKKPKEFVYGFLDFCSIICSPSRPNCGKCFLNERCVFYKKVNFEKLKEIN